MNRRFGIEIECIGMTRDEAERLLVEAGINCQFHGNYTHTVVDCWKVVTDSSVGIGIGCEVVSPPLRGEEGLVEAKRVVEILNGAGCDVNKRCGLHVHIECNDLSAQHIANIYNRYRNNEERIDQFMPQSRRASNNSHCKSMLLLQSGLPVQPTTIETTQQRTDRYYKVNLASFVKYGTVEFRHHSGTLNVAKLENWVRFLQQFVEASRPNETSMVTTRPGTKKQAIIDILSSTGGTASEIAQAVNTTVQTVRTMIRNLRLAGMVVVVNNRRYRAACSDASTTNHELWHGIDGTIRTYYERRAAILAA